MFVAHLTSHRHNFHAYKFYALNSERFFSFFPGLLHPPLVLIVPQITHDHLHGALRPDLALAPTNLTHHYTSSNSESS